MDSDLTIHTVDNIEHRIPRLIFNMLGNLQSQLEQIGPILKLNSVKSEEFSLIIEYCNHHNYVNPPPISRPLKFNELKKCVVDEWDSDFINAIDIDGITDLLISCERLNCSSLLDLCYAKLALFYRGIYI